MQTRRGKGQNILEENIGKEGRDMCHSESSYLSSRRFLFRHAGVMLEVKINHWLCFHGTCIVNILKLWTITWSWRQKWAKRCTFRHKWHAHTFLYRCFFCFIVSLSSPVGYFDLWGFLCFREWQSDLILIKRIDLQIVSYKC